MGPPQNPLKRKNNAEGRGEPSRSAPSSRPVNLAMNKAGPASQTPLPSKFSAGRYSAAAVGNNSLGNSVGPDRRGFSNQYDRPQTTMKNSRIQRIASSTHRSNSSLDIYSRPPNGLQGIGNKGRISFPSNSSQVYKSPMKPESVGCYDPQIYYDLGWESPCAKGRLRDVSVTSALKGLTVNGKTTPLVDMNASLTPSQIPQRAYTRLACAVVPSTSRSPKKALSLGRFLTRDSNTPVAWDTDDKWKKMEHGFSELYEKIDGATSEYGNLKDTIAIYKTRSRWMWVAHGEARLIYRQLTSWSR